MKKSLRTRAGGFTLIEIAIVIAIMGFISVGLLNLASVINTKTGTSQTRLTMDAIESALRRFLLANNRLPCPADATAAAGTAGYGAEDVVVDGNNNVTNCGPNVFPIPGPGSPTDFAGVVPFQTLGLAGDFITDGWEHQISYVVLAAAALENSYRGPVVLAAPVPLVALPQLWPADLTINDNAGSDLVDNSFEFFADWIDVA